MRARVKRSAFVAVLGLTALAGCGGAGGGGPDTPTIPGTLAALALEGGTAPGTTGGTFGAFGPTTLLAVADGGWTMAEYRQDLHHQLLRFKLISLLFTASITISDDAVQAEYAAEKAKNPALGESAGELEHLRAVLFERALSEATARWLAEAHRNAYVELRL